MVSWSGSSRGSGTARRRTNPRRSATSRADCSIPRAGPQTFRTLCEAISATGQDEAWHVFDDRPDFSSNAAIAVNALAGYGEHAWSWEMFQAIVTLVEAVRKPDSEARGLAGIAQGLQGMQRDSSPPWLGEAVRLVFARCIVLPPGERRDKALQALPRQCSR